MRRSRCKLSQVAEFLWPLHFAADHTCRGKYLVNSSKILSHVRFIDNLESFATILNVTLY